MRATIVPGGEVTYIVREYGLVDAHLRQLNIQAICIGVDCVALQQNAVTAQVTSVYPNASSYAKRLGKPGARIASAESWGEPGTVEFVESSSPSERPHVFNLLTQWNAGKSPKSSESSRKDGVQERNRWLNDCLLKLEIELEKTQTRSVAFPWRLGCSSGQRQWPEVKAMINAFARRNPRVRVYVVQTSADCIRHQHRAQRKDIANASRKAQKLIDRLPKGMTRLLAEQLTAAINKQLYESIANESFLQAESQAESRTATTNVGVPDTASTHDASSLFARKLEAEVGKLTELQSAGLEEAAAAVRASNDATDEAYRKHILKARANGEVTDATVMAACSDYQQNWASRVRPAATISRAPKNLPVVMQDGREGNAMGYDKETDCYSVALDHPGADGKFHTVQVLSGTVEDARSITASSRSCTEETSATKANSTGGEIEGRTDKEVLASCFLGIDSTKSDRVKVSSAQGPRAPARLLAANLVCGTARVNIPVNIIDSGSGTCILGHDTALDWETRYPGSIRKVQPLPSSVYRIRGIGAQLNMVAFWVSFTIDLGGCEVDFEDMPVLRGQTGLLLGNDFIGQGNCILNYSTSACGHDGTVIVRAPSGRASAPVPFTASPMEVPSFLAQPERYDDRTTASANSASIVSDETGSNYNEIDCNSACTRSTLEAPLTTSACIVGEGGRVSFNVSPAQSVSKKVSLSVNEVAPIAFNPQSIRVAAWSEQLIKVRVPASLVKQNTLALLPLESQEYGDLGVLVAACVTKADKDGYVWARVINLSKQPVNIPMLTPIARFVIDPDVGGVDAEFETAEIMDQVHIGPETKEEKAKISAMLDRRRSIFRTTLGYCHLQKMHIDTKAIDDGLVQPPAAPNQTRSPDEHAALETARLKFLKNRIIEPSRSPFNARAVPIRKPDGTFRVVLDFRNLNLHTIKDTYPLPNIEVNLAALGKANWFTTLDLLQGFHQIEIEEGDKHKTAFTIGSGQYQFTRMPMGLTSSPGAFMRLVDASLRGLPPGIAIAYVDDVLIPTSGTLDDHLRDVGLVFDKLIESGFAVRCDKVHIAMKEVPYLGFLAGAGGTRPQPEKTQTILDLAYDDMTNDPAAASRYAGMIGYYHRFIPDLHSALAVFHECKAKGANIKSLTHSLRFRSAFEYTKHALAKVTALARPDFDKPFYIDVDAASSTGIGCALSQRDDDNDPDSHRPLAFWSRRFANEERRYGVRDQECLGLSESLEYWRHMVNGAHVIVRTDHRSLEWLLKTQHRPGTRVSGWALKCQGYDVDIRYVPGNTHIVADTFSRARLVDGPPTQSESTSRAPIEDRVDDALDAATDYINRTATTFAAGHELFEPKEAAKDSNFDADSIISDAATELQVTGGNIEGNSWSTAETGVAVFAFFAQFCSQLETGNIASAAVGEAVPLQTDPVNIAPIILPIIGARHSPRAAVAFIRNRNGSLEVLTERQGDTCQLPSVTVDMSESASCYRSQLAQRLHFTYRGELLVASLRHFASSKACQRRLIRDSSTHFFVTDASCIEHVEPSSRMKSQFEIIDSALLKALDSRDDAMYLNRFLTNRLSGPSRHLVQSVLAGGTVADACSTAIADEEVDLTEVATIDEAPNGPALCATDAHFLLAGQRLLERLRTYPSLSISVDLEGHQLGIKGTTCLIQVAVDAGVDTQSPLIYVFDTLSCNLHLRQACPLREILEDESIVKVFHCCYGDAAALFHEFKVTLKGVFDTGVADSVALAQHVNKARRLDTVIYHWLGDNSAHLQYKGKLVHSPGLWFQRPLGQRLFVYAYEDVVFCNALYVAQRNQLRAQGLLELTFALSAQRCPPAALPVTFGRHAPVTNIAVALIDLDGRVLCTRDCGNSELSLPQGLSTSATTVNESKARASEIWREIMGPPGREVKIAVNSRLRKGVRVGDTMLYVGTIRNLADLLPDIQELTTSHSTRIEVCTRPSYCPEAPSDGVSSSQRVLFQYLHAMASRVEQPKTAIVPVFSAETDVGLRVAAPLRVSATGSRGVWVSVTLFTSLFHSVATTNAPAVAAAAVPVVNPRGAVVLHDGLLVYVLTCPDNWVAFPSLVVDEGETPADAAMRAFDIFAGVSLRKQPSPHSTSAFHLMPRLSQLMHTAFTGMPLLGEIGNTLYLNCQLPPGTLSDFRSSFFASRTLTNGFQLTDQYLKKHPDFRILPIASAVALQSEAVLRITGKHLKSAQAELFVLETLSRVLGLPRIPAVLPQHSGALSLPPHSAEALEPESAPQHSGDLPSPDESTLSVTLAVDSNWQDNDAESVGNSCEDRFDGPPPSEPDDDLCEDCFEPRVFDLPPLHSDPEYDTLFAAAATANLAHICSELSTNTADVAKGEASPLTELNLVDVRLEQRAHPSTARYVDYLELGIISAPWRDASETDRVELAAGAAKMRLNNGLLLWKSEEAGGKDRIVLPPRFHTLVCNMYHNQLAHLGLTKSLPLIFDRFHWGSKTAMRKTLADHIRHCEPCARAKMPGHKSGEYQMSNAGAHPNDLLSGDVFDVGVEHGGLRSTIDFVCHFSKRVTAEPSVAAPTSEDIARVLVDVIIRHHGKPSEIRSDRGSNYISAAIRELYVKLSIRINPGTAYQHQIVALVERWHKTLKTLLLCQKASGLDDNWPARLPLLELAYNATVNASTGYSPFFLDHLRHATLPMDAMTRSVSKPDDETMDGWVKDRCDDLSVVYDAATTSLRVNALHAKKRYDLRRDVSQQFKPGDSVLLVKGLYVDGKLPKSELPTEGPFTVSKCLPRNRYVLSDLATRRIHNVINVARLLPFPDHPATESTWMISETASGGQWPVKRVLDKRVSRHRLTKVTQLEYKVRFVGFDTPIYDKWLAVNLLDSIAPLINLYEIAKSGDTLVSTEPRVDRATDAPPPPPSPAAVSRPRFRRRAPERLTPPPLATVVEEDNDGTDADSIVESSTDARERRALGQRSRRLQREARQATDSAACYTSSLDPLSFTPMGSSTDSRPLTLLEAMRN